MWAQILCYNKPEQAIEIHSNPKNNLSLWKKNWKNRKFDRKSDSRAKLDPRRNLCRKIFASKNSPWHLESKCILLKKFIIPLIILSLFWIAMDFYSLFRLVKSNFFNATLYILDPELVQRQVLKQVLKIQLALIEE